MQQYNCTQCGKEFRNPPSDRSKFCSLNCKANSQIKDYKHICKRCDKSFISKDKIRSYCSRPCAAMSRPKGIVAWNKGIKFEKISGSKHWNWKGGNRRGKRGAEQRRFRNSVLKRDGYQCVLCGDDDRLIADHIKSYAEYPELREVVSNGRTLCYDCNYESTYIKKEWQVA